jgi:hypothetical protein
MAVVEARDRLVVRRIAIAVSLTSSLLVSRCAKPLRMATIRPPWSLMPSVAGSLSSFHERCAPLAGRDGAR